MEGSQVQRIAARMATAAAPVGRQDFLIPRAGNQLLRSRAGGQRSCFEIWRTKLSPAISRRRLTRFVPPRKKSCVLERCSPRQTCDHRHGRARRTTKYEILQNELT